MLPEDKHIESVWKTAFDEAAISPSESIWEGLETILTEQQETTTWQNAFGNAEIAPTPKLWKKVEAELNRKKRTSFMFWVNSNTIKVAAGVLLIWGVYQLSGISGMYQNVMLSLSKHDNQNQQAKANIQKGKKATRQQVANNQLSVTSNQQPVTSNQQANVMLSSSKQGRKPSSYKASASLSLTTLNIVQSGNETPSDAVLPSSAVVLSLSKHDNQNQQAKANIQKGTEATMQQVANKLSVTSNQQSSTKLAPHTSYLISHISYLRPNPAHFIVIQPHISYFIPHNSYSTPQPSKKQFWIAFNSGTSSFNPNLNLAGVQGVAVAAFSDDKIFESNVAMGTVGTASMPSSSGGKSTNFASANMPQNESQAGLGIQFGVLAGIKLGKKTSFETGVQVLKGSSVFNTNTFLIDRQTSQKTDLYTLGVSESATADIAQQAVGIVSEAASLSNNYVFLQLPFRVGYQIFQKEKIGLTASGGFSADVFIANHFGDVVQRNTYKTLNSSALLGLSANYKLYDRWYWNAGLNYQHSLFPNNKSTALIGMKLKMTVLSMGLQYKF